MANLEWDDSLNTGVLFVDTQHKQLVAILNSLNQAMEKGEGRNKLGQILKELIDYTKVHFAAEEAIFEKLKYPQEQAHKLEHQELVTKVLQFQKQFESGGVSLTIDVLDFLQDWILVHIKKSDKAFGEWSRANKAA